MGFFSFALGLLPGPAPVAHNCEDLSVLLQVVLPTFIAVADRKRNFFPEIELSGARSETADHLLWDFYPRLYASLTNLRAILVLWNSSEIIQDPNDEANMRLLLEAVSSCLESRFLSRKDGKVEAAFKRLGLEQSCNTTFWKLRALKKSKRLPLAEEGITDEYLNDIDLVFRFESKKAAKRHELLKAIEAAFEFFSGIQLFAGEPTSSCPLQYLNYPLKNVPRLTRSLFEVVQSKWSCQCDWSVSHVDRKARLNLTQYQRFDTAPLPGQVVSESMHCYRLFFPTTVRDIEWQDTDVAIDCQEYLDIEHHEIENDFCEVVHNVKARIRPRTIVWARKLWLLRAVIEDDPSVATQIRDEEFVSLPELLRQRSSAGDKSSNLPSQSPSWTNKDSLILSFVLVTTLLHLFRLSGQRLQADLRSENICFLRPHRRSRLDITRPYLTIKCGLHTPTSPNLHRNQPHRFPEILALGLLLLEIERGSTITLDASQDPCVVGIKEFDDWTRSLNMSQGTRTVPEGLRHAIAACIHPKQFATHNLDKANIRDNDVRRYIFDRILYPLEEALFDTYEIKPSMLSVPPNSTQTIVKEIGFIDGEESSGINKYDDAIAKEWMRNLEGVHDLVFACQDRFGKFPVQDAEPQNTGRVRIAVLDTGLQLPRALGAVYKAEGRILIKHSKSFVPRAHGEDTAARWDVDGDGHGSQVGELVLRCAPCVDLHVAKVFRTRQDLMNPALTTQVHKRIVDAIDYASNHWKADMIIMCFGFDEPIRAIRDAIDKATKAKKAPLFFAATRNNGAHQEVAWPARDLSVIGISSTTAEGAASSFNSCERKDAYPILYAFGENVPIKVPDPQDPDRFITKHMSGTSFATPIAAALAANLLGCVRIMASSCSPEDHARFSHLPGDLQERRGMLQVLLTRMQSEHISGQKSILPWKFLDLDMLKRNKLLEMVDEAING